jgi:hypothetical protein
MDQRKVFLASSVLGIVIIGLQVRALAGWDVVYETGFAADPFKESWTTTNPANFYWNPSEQTLHVKQQNVNYGGYYGAYNVGHDGGSFKLDSDIKITQNQYASAVSFGIYDSDMTSEGNGSYIKNIFGREDAGRTILADSQNASNVYTSDWTKEERWNLNTWYNVSMVYDTSKNSVTSTIKDRSTGNPVGTKSFSVGPFSADMSYVGSSNIRDGIFQSPGAYSTAEIDNVVFSQPSSEPGIYGVFVGYEDIQSDDNGDLQSQRGDLGATALFDVFKENVPAFHEGDSRLVIATSSDGGISPSRVEQAIEEVKAKIAPGDKFVFYTNAHGSNSGGAEGNLEFTAATASEERVHYGSSNSISDDTLTRYLTGMDGIEKWVFVDSCYSGGFWGNPDNPLEVDEGDLGRLSQISMFAAAPETEYSFFQSDDYGFFSHALRDAFDTGAFGYLNGDLNVDGDVSFTELRSYLTVNYTPGWLGLWVLRGDYGGPIIFTEDMWNPVAFKSSDFNGSLGYGEPVPAPGAVVLGILGLSYAGWRLRRRAI